MGKLYVRVDDRLIHGQTIVAWCPTLNIKEIICVDNVSATNPMLKSILTMSAPKIYKTEIVTVDQAKEKLAVDSDNNRLVIVKYPHQVYELQENIKDCELVILGNMAKREDTKHQLTGATGIFYVSDQDVEEISALVEKGFKVVFQQLPAANPVSWESFKKSL